jgi:eukaryotic-like serine/threonine-protein kinase
MPRCPGCHRRLAIGAVCPLDGEAAPPPSVTPGGAAPAVPGFVIGAPLGAGGFATTWAATRGGEEVAVKIGRVPSLAAAERLAREADALARVGPPTAPALVDSGETSDGRPFLAMERIRGALLSDELAGLAGPPPADWIAAVGDALLAALERVHAAGVVHRDLKPENIFLCRGAARVIDFGIAALGGARGSTRPGVAVGSPEYMAPEQIRGGPVSPASDVYAVGALLYELAALRPPFVGDLARIEYGHLTLRPAPPGELVALPPGLDALVLDCLAKASEERPDLASLRARLAEACRAPARPPHAAPARAELVRQPVVLLAAPAELKPGQRLSLEPVLRRHGFAIGSRGRLVLCGFAAESGDPVRAARRAAVELASAGAPVALHVASLIVRARSSGPPLLVGDAVSRPETWCPEPLAPGIHASAEFARAEPSAPPSGEAPLVGRDAELAAARAGLAQVMAERRPGLFTLLGGPGLGKSRLARELAALVEREAPGAVLVASAGAFTDGEQLRELARATAVAAIVDDADEAGEAVLDALDYASLDGDGIALWVCVVADPRLARERPGWGQRARHHRRAELAPLPLASAVELTAHLLRPAEYPSEEALVRVAQRADGSPLHLVELCRALAAGGFIRQNAAGRYYVAAGELDQLPRSPAVEWLAERELDGLTPELAELARVCALLEPGFDRDEVDAVSSRLGRGSTSASADVGVGLFQLAARGLLVSDPSSGGASSGAYRLASATLRAGIERSLSPERRAKVHREALAAWRAPDRALHPRALAARALHAAGSGDAHDAAAAHMELAEIAARAHRHIDADRHFGAALDCAVDDRVRARALLGRGRIRYRIDRAGDALSDLEAAERLAGTLADRHLAAEALFEQATALDWDFHYRASAERAERAAAAAADLADPRLEARTALARGRSAWRAEHIDAAVAHLTLAAEAAAALGDVDTRVVALLLLGPALVRAGEVERAEARFDEVLSLTAQSGDRVHQCAAHGNRMILWSARKRPDLARADLRAAVLLARQVGHPGPERVATYNLAEDLYWSGEDDSEALELARHAQFLSRRFLVKPVADDAILVARIAIARGDDESARTELAWSTGAVPPDEMSPPVRVHARVIAAWLDLAAPSAWQALCDEAERTPELPGDDLIEVFYRASLAAHRNGDIALARNALERAESRLADFPTWRRRIASLAELIAECH